MARRTVFASVLAVLVAALLAPSAFAHPADPRFDSLLDSVSPSVKGLSVQVLNGQDIEVDNHSSQTITIEGYQKEPYLRMQPDGTVSVNVLSPAYYLNVDTAETTPVPASATPQAAMHPQWKVVGHDGRYQFHDHRVHWMSTSVPPQVTNKAVRTKVADWSVPLQADGKSGSISGTLFWRGSPGGAPIGALIALALVVLLGGAAVVIVRRRRAAADDGEDGEGGSGGAGGTGGGANRDGGDGGTGTTRPGKTIKAGSVKEAW